MSNLNDPGPISHRGVATSPLKIWVHSDLQLQTPQLAQATLSPAVDDLLDLRLGLDAAWCLGDALCGENADHLEQVARIQIEQMARLNLPVYYVMGNHETDYRRKVGVNFFPLHARARKEEFWHAADLEDFYLLERMGRVLIVLMGDHAAHDGSWWTTSGIIKGDFSRYPHKAHAYQQLRREISGHEGPVLIASHYALPGGQRPSRLLEPLLPLPNNVVVHLHGHAHIGDLVHNAENPWQRRNRIDGEIIRQYNISALESVRSPGSHSAILEVNEEG